MPAPGGAPPAATGAPPRTGAPLGSTLSVTVGSALLQLTLVRVLDPARGAGLTPPSGYRFVGADLRITNPGRATAEIEPELDTHLVDRAGGVYNLGMDNGNLADCPRFANGTGALAPGQTAEGCVGFELPATTTVAAVLYAAPGAPALESARWSTG